MNGSVPASSLHGVPKPGLSFLYLMDGLFPEESKELE